MVAVIVPGFVVSADYQTVGAKSGVRDNRQRFHRIFLVEECCDSLKPLQVEQSMADHQQVTAYLCIGYSLRKSRSCYVKTGSNWQKWFAGI